MKRERGLLSLTAATFALAVVTLVSCTVSLDNPAGRACDDTHGCAQGRVCKNGVCVSPLAADAAIEGASSDGGPDAPDANLDPIGTFATGCDPWIAFQGDATPSTVGHSDSASCRACGGASTDFTLDDKGFLRSPTPGHYTAHAWIRTAPGKPAPTDVGILLRTIKESGGQQDVERNAVNATVSDDWVEGTATLEVTKPADALNVVVYAVQTTGAGACVLVDDVTVERAP